MVARHERLSEVAKQYIAGLTHAHTVLSNHKGHRESDLSVDRLVQTLVEANLAGSDDAPLQYLMLNEHPSDPARPRRLGRLSLRGRRLLQQRRRPDIMHVPMFYGLEVSLMANGATDLTPRLADHCALVIGSRHALPDKVERDPDSIMSLFELACRNPVVEVLGHPPRYIEDLNSIDWVQVFRWAAETGTAVEVNMNAFPAAAGTRLQHHFWKKWLRTLARSKADVFIGTDLHNQYQLDEFILQWRSLNREASRLENHLARFLEALIEAGIKPEKVVTSTYERFTDWLQIDKAKRTRLPLDK